MGAHRTLLFSFSLLLLGNCGQPKNYNNMEDQNHTTDPEDGYNIVEKPGEAGQPVQRDTSLPDYDYVVSEAAFGRINGVPFTVGAIYDEEKDGKTVYTVTIDINKERLVDVYDGDILELNAETKVRVVKIEFEEEPKKGRVFFKMVK